MRRSTVLFIVMMFLLLISVSAALWWRVDSEVKHYSAHQQQLMEKQASLSANSIDRYIASLRNRMIAVSLDALWLRDLERYQSLDKMQIALEQRFRLYFPEMNAFTISNAQGEQLWGDLDFFTGEACRADLEKTAAMLSYDSPYFEYQPSLHAKPGDYHFDMMFPVLWNQKKLVLFMSFKAQNLSSSLKENVISDHFSYLLRIDKPGLIEVTPDQVREDLLREFYLQAAELKRVSARLPVPYTKWEVAVVKNPGVIKQFQETLYRDAAVAWGIFLGLWGSLLWFGLQHERSQGHLFRKLSHQSMHDELTGLSNRRQLIRALQTALESLRHQGIQCALLYMDLNDFKRVNDRYGHDVGDQLLIAFSERLQQCIRKQDIAVRLGGDEFVVLLNQLSQAPETAKKVLSETKQRCNESLSRPYVVNGVLIECPPSIGQVLLTPEMRDVDEVLKAGDGAMYLEKQAHKDKTTAG